MAIDLFCGLGGWTEGLLAEGYFVVGFDIEQHAYGEHRYPAQLVIQDVLTLHGAQFKDASLIVASPPCQEFSYMAMPWTRAKEKARKLREGPPEDRARLTALFDACFRIQREAIEAAGHHIPLVVENVRGANEWVGRSRWNFGSFHLWGDVPALMPMARRFKQPGMRFDGSGKSWQSEAVKVGGLDWSKHAEPDYRTSGAGGCFRDSAIKNAGGSWFNIAHNTTSGHGQNPDGRKLKDQDGYERNHPAAFGWKASRTNSKSPKRKAASALIAKIPLALASHIARYWHPQCDQLLLTGSGSRE